MAIPTIDQIEGIWVDRTNDEGNHYIQAVFFKEGHSDQAHQSHCRILIHRGSLQPERADHLAPAQRKWDQDSAITAPMCELHAVERTR